MSLSKRDKLGLNFFVGIVLLFIAVMLYYPFIQNFFYSFCNWDGFTDAEFTGLANYKRMLSDPVIGKALINTIILLVSTLLCETFLSLILAILVDSITRGYKAFRTLFFFPVLISGTAIGLMFSLFYNYDCGLFNAVFKLFGLDRVVWLTEQSSLTLTILPAIWQYIGFYFVIMLTGLSKIPTEIYEAAVLDGITGFKKAIYITIPLIKELIATCMLLMVTGVLKTFDTTYVITNGGPMNSSELLSTYMYNKTFTDLNYGYGSTIAVLIIALGLVAAFLTKKFTKSETITY